MEPGISGLLLLAGCRERRFRIVELAHRLRSLGYNAGHDVAQERGLSGSRRTVDPEESAVSRFAECKIYRRLLEECERVPTRPRWLEIAAYPN